MSTLPAPDFVHDTTIAERFNSSMSKLESRKPQMFPRLNEAEIARLMRFGSICSWQDGQTVFAAGGNNPGMLLLLKGQIRISQCDGMGNNNTIVDHGPG